MYQVIFITNHLFLRSDEAANGTGRLLIPRSAKANVASNKVVVLLMDFMLIYTRSTKPLPHNDNTPENVYMICA